jgi:hypothetical protein
MILNSVIFDVQKTGYFYDEKTLNRSIDSKIFSIIALHSLTPAVFNLKIHLVKIPEAATPEMTTAAPPCV